ncbi:MAG: single-stranded DNA-binding protein [Actinomycetota bacterium]
MANINRVILVGNLTRDPELRSTGSGLSVCTIRIAVNNRRKKGDTGEWVEEPNYFNVTTFGAQADNVARYLAKGRQVAVDGRLSWSEYEAKDGSGKRERVEVIADSVQFIGPREGGGGGGGGAASGGGEWGAPAAASEPAADLPDQWAGGGAAADDDIPF